MTARRFTTSGRLLSWLTGLLYFLGLPAQAQFAGWRAYHEGSSVSSVALEGPKVWVGTTGGLAMVDQTTGTTAFYNRANSGLPNDGVAEVAVDSRGAKWVSTRGGGVARLTGSTWTAFNRSNTPLTSNDVLALAVDRQDGVWVSGVFNGNMGVARFDGSTWTVYSAANGAAALDEPVVSITQDATGTMWFGTAAAQLGDGGHLLRFNGSTWQSYHHSTSGLPQDDLKHVAVDAEGKVWVSLVSRGLVVFNGTSWRHYHAGNSGLRTNTITHTAFDATGKAWLSTAAGVYTFDGTTWTSYNPSNSGLTTAYVTTVALDAAGKRYLGTSPGLTTPGGLYTYDGSAWQQLPTSNSALPYNCEVAGLAVAGSNTLWLATRSTGLGRGGLLRFDGSAWNLFDSANSPLPNDMVNAVAEGPDGALWVGTGFDRASPTAAPRGGLARLDGAGWTVYHVGQNGLPEGMVNSIVFQGTTTRWLATSYGLVRFNQNGFTHWHTGNSALPDNTANAVAVDAQGRKWVATSGGLARFDDANWQVFNTQNSALPSNTTTSVLAAADGSLWVGTWRGLARLQNGSWTVYTTASGLPSDKVLRVQQAPGGSIWVGTEDGGVATFDGTGWRRFDPTNAPLMGNRMQAFAFQGPTVWMADRSLYAYGTTVTSSRGPVAKPAEALLYPNPSRGLVQLSPGQEPYERVEAFNLLGQLVYTGRVSGPTLDLTQLPAGLYQVRLHATGGVHVAKLLIE